MITIANCEHNHTNTNSTWLDQLRASKAQAVLYGEGFDVSSRFGVTSDDEKGQILLKKIFELYQDGD